MKEFNYRDLSIDTTDISNELATQAEKFVFVAEKFFHFQGQYDLSQRRLEELYAQLDGEVRREAENSGKKITEKAIEAQIKLNPIYKQKQEEVIKLKIQVGLLKSLKEAWIMRGENIHALARNMRDECFLGNKTTIKEYMG